MRMMLIQIAKKWICVIICLVAFPCRAYYLNYQYVAPKDTAKLTHFAEKNFVMFMPYYNNQEISSYAVREYERNNSQTHTDICKYKEILDNLKEMLLSHNMQFMQNDTLMYVDCTSTNSEDPCFDQLIMIKSNPHQLIHYKRDPFFQKRGIVSFDVITWEQYKSLVKNWLEYYYLPNEYEIFKGWPGLDPIKDSTLEGYVGRRIEFTESLLKASNFKALLQVVENAPIREYMETTELTYTDLSAGIITIADGTITSIRQVYFCEPLLNWSIWENY